MTGTTERHSSWRHIVAKWSYDRVAQWYDYDMGLNMPFDDIAGYRRLLPDPPARILEVGCGTGRLTFPLARAGYAMTGLDRSTAMLDQFARKLKADRLHLQNKIRLIHQDARSMRLAERFNAIVFGYSGFQYFLSDEDVAQFCTRVADLLMNNGCLIIDIFLHQPQATSNEFSLDFERSLPDGSKLSRRKRVVLDGRTNHVERRYAWQAAKGTNEVPYEREVRTVSRQRLYTSDELVTLLRLQGFRCEKYLFDYQAPSAISNAQFFTGRFSLMSAKPDRECSHTP